MPDPLISICVPSYERTEFLKRLLDSIKMQKFRNFEVIFTDDSNTDNVQRFLEQYDADFPLLYYKNVPSLGTAKNMLEGLKYANSQWIKMIHDDDFFASENAIEEHTKAIKKKVRFVFSGFNTYFENSAKTRNDTITQTQFKKLYAEPSLLFANNPIGPPSVMMIHKSVTDVFDNRLKWFTDVEYYLRMFEKEEALYIDQPLINISVNETQVSSYARTNPDIVVPETIYIINKHGKKVTSNIVVYDAWWRVFRNMGITKLWQLEKYVKPDEIPVIVKKIIKHQQLIPKPLLKTGIISKCCMAVSYTLYKLSR